MLSFPNDQVAVPQWPIYLLGCPAARPVALSVVPGAGSKSFMVICVAQAVPPEGIKLECP